MARREKLFDLLACQNSFTDLVDELKSNQAETKVVSVKFNRKTDITEIKKKKNSRPGPHFTLQTSTEKVTAYERT